MEEETKDEYQDRLAAPLAYFNVKCCSPNSFVCENLRDFGVGGGKKKPHKNKFINELPFFFFGSIYNDVATLLPAGVESGQFGEQPNNGGNGNGNTHHDDDGRMTFKIPNIGGQVITLAKRIIPFV